MNQGIVNVDNPGKSREWITHEGERFNNLDGI